MGPFPLALLYDTNPSMDKAWLAQRIATALEEADCDALVDSENLARVVIDGRFNLWAVADRLLSEMAARKSEGPA